MKRWGEINTSAFGPTTWRIVRAVDAKMMTFKQLCDAIREDKFHVKPALESLLQRGLVTTEIRPANGDIPAVTYYRLTGVGYAEMTRCSPVGQPQTVGQLQRELEISGIAIDACRFSAGMWHVALRLEQVGRRSRGAGAKHPLLTAAIEIALNELRAPVPIDASFDMQGL